MIYIEFFPYCLFVSNSQLIGCEDCLWNDLYCVGCGVKLYSIQSSAIRGISILTACDVADVSRQWQQKWGRGKVQAIEWSKLLGGLLSIVLTLPNYVQCPCSDSYYVGHSTCSCCHYDDDDDDDDYYYYYYYYYDSHIIHILFTEYHHMTYLYDGLGAADFQHLTTTLASIMKCQPNNLGKLWKLPATKKHTATT